MRTWRPRALPLRRLATTGGAPQGARSVTPIVGSDYQSDRHCAKTLLASWAQRLRRAVVLSRRFWLFAWSSASVLDWRDKMDAGCLGARIRE